MQKKIAREVEMKDSDWQILYELYRTPNITKVANKLYVAQPSITKRIQMIEEEFQITLVNRTTKGVEFTREGELLAQKAVEYLDFMRQVRKELRELQESENVVITIGSSYTYSKYVLSDLLFQYSKEHPEIHFEVQTDQSNMLFRKACDGDVDVAFLRGDYEGPVEQGRIDEFKAYVLTRDAVALEDLPDMQRIEYNMNDKSRELLENWWKEQYKTEVPEAMNAGFVDVAWQLVEKGFGYTCCFMPDNFENKYGFTLTPMLQADGTPVARNTWFVYKKHKRMSKQLKEFIQYVEDNVVVEM